MTGRSRVQSLAASPTMVGAITTLIVIVAVFLAYNANNGLPFVPVYRISAELPNAARLGPNNEVRIGGNRVGVVESIETTRNETNGQVAAKLNLKLDKSAEPVPEDTTVRVRYRSSFGLKYLELERGTGPGVPEGGTLTKFEEQTEFDDIGNTFDTKTRENARVNLEGFGSSFAGRGASLNQAIENLDPLFTNLRPVARALSDPTTDLVRFFPELADAARIVAPVAVANAEQFTNAAIAFAAISFDEQALKDTISSGVATLEVGTRSLRAQRPFLADFAEVSRLLRPGVRQLRIALPTLNKALVEGTPVLLRSVRFNNDTKDVFTNLNNLVLEPSTKISLLRLEDLFTNANSAGQTIVPYQTVCNYWNYWFQFLPEHFSGEDKFGLAERLILTSAPGLTAGANGWPMNPMDNYSGGQANGRYSVLANSPRNGSGPASNPPGGLFDPHGLVPPPAFPPGSETSDQPILHGNPYGPSGTAEDPTCQSGQVGYALGEGLSPNQSVTNPTFAVTDIEAKTGVDIGRTNLFLRQNGTKEFTNLP